MDTDILNRLEKQMEGNGLALAAVAEVLQKMDFRLSKAESDEDKEDKEKKEVEEMQYAEMEKAELIKSIAFEVGDLMKAGQYSGDRGMPVDGEHIRTATKTGAAKNADDSESAVTTDTKTENVQGIIQAMQKELDLLKEGHWDDGFSQGDPVGEEEEDDDAEEKRRKEYPVEEALQNMQKQIISLKKGMETGTGGMGELQAIVKRESEDRLRKMGFREETSLQGPRLIKYDDPSMLGTDGTSPIKKSSSPENTVDELSKLSYKQLRDMQTQIEVGNTDGLPQELVN